MYIHQWTPPAELAGSAEFFLPLWVSLNSQAIFYQQKPSAWPILKAKSHTWISKCTLLSTETIVAIYITIQDYTVELFMLACVLCHCIHF